MKAVLKHMIGNQLCLQNIQKTSQDALVQSLRLAAKNTQTLLFFNVLHSYDMLGALTKIFFENLAHTVVW